MKKRRLNPTAIGAFVIGAIAIAVASIILFGSGRWFGGDRVTLVCFFEDAVDGMQIGSKVKLKGVPIGEVKGILLRFQQNSIEGEAGTKPLIPVIIEVDVDRLSNDLGVNMDFREDELYRKQIDDGLRATLGISNFITGILQVNLDYHDDVEKQETLKPFIYRGAEYRVIPTLPSQMAEATNDLLSVVNNISNADFKGVVEGLNELLDNVNEKLAQFEVKGMNKAIESFQARMESPKFDEALESFSEAADAVADATEAVEEVAASLKAQLGDDTLGSTVNSADETFQALTEAIDHVSTVMESSQEVPSDLTAALQEISGMATEIKELAAYLKERPNALLFGRKDEDEPAPERERKPWMRAGR